jgi:hypothetical protein
MGHALNLVFRLIRRQEKRERGTAALGATNFNGAVMSLDYAFHQCETQANTGHLGSVALLSSVKRFENMWSVNGRNAWTAILYRDPYPLSLRFVYFPYSDRHRFPGGGIFDGIVDQVLKTAVHETNVYGDKRQTWLNIEFNLHTGVLQASLTSVE